MLKKINWMTVALIVVIVIAAAILFRGCPSEPEIKTVETIKIDSSQVVSLRKQLDSMENENAASLVRAIDAEREVTYLSRKVVQIGQRYKDARDKKDTVVALQECDSLVYENKVIAAKMETNFTTYRNAANGLRATIHTQKTLIDTLTGEVKVLRVENSRLVTISNENAAAAKKLIRKNKRLALLTKIEAGVIIAMGALFAITN